MPESISQLNLQDVMQVLQKRWKTIAGFVFVVLLMTTALLFFVLPKYYKSVATVVAANPELADKARLFNNNIQSLYSSFGKEEDLDRIYGIANLDTTFKQLVDDFNLTTYYPVKGTPAQKRQSAALKLRDDVQLLKTELLELKISVYTKNKELSANIANRLTEIVQAAVQELWNSAYKKTLAATNGEIQQLQQQLLASDNSSSRLPGAISTASEAVVMQQLLQYQKMAAEFKMAIKSQAPALYVLEKAVPSVRVDRPNKVNVLVATFFISLLFAVLAALLLDRNQQGL